MRLQLIAAATVLAATAGTTAADENGDWRITSDTLLYSDTNNVLVVSPQLAVHRNTDDEGGDVSARVVIDSISAASVDVVSHATDRFSEVRTEGDFALSKTLGKYLPSVSYRYSKEPDYISHGFGAGVQRDLGSADTTLALGYNVSLDTVGWTGTPTSAFSKSLVSHGGALSLTQVLGPNTLIRAVYTLSYQNGYMEKVYRFVPLFDSNGIAMAQADGVTINLSNFNTYRLPTRVAEEVPDTRVGHAVAFRLMRYLSALSGSAQLDYQVFADSWGIMAHTVSPSLNWRPADNHIVTAYGRLYLQPRAASFWRREYVVPAGTAPKYRTLDRELSNYYSVTGGSRYEWKHGSFSGYLDAAGMETFYSNYIFLKSRFALIVQAGLRWQL